MTQKSRKRVKDRLDNLLHKIVYKRENGHCENCGRWNPSSESDVHHPNKKQTFALRYYVAGTVLLCWNCHVYLGDNPLYNERWYIEKYGQPAWDKLVELRNQTGMSLEEAEENLKKEAVCI